MPEMLSEIHLVFLAMVLVSNPTVSVIEGWKGTLKLDTTWRSNNDDRVKSSMSQIFYSNWSL